MEHAQDTDSLLAARIASAAILAVQHIDAERSRMYLDLISLSRIAPEAIEATMNSLGFEYHSDFARRYYYQGKTEGKAEGKSEGRADVILRLLTLRFGALPEEIQTRVSSAPDADLDALTERVLTAETLEEALSAVAG